MEGKESPSLMKAQFMDEWHTELLKHLYDKLHSYANKQKMKRKRKRWRK
jgi:hypothetical protein